MPRLKQDKSEQSDRLLLANIRRGMVLADVSPDELALAMCTSPKTVYARFKNPGMFRITELQAVSERLKIPISQLLFGELAERGTDDEETHYSGHRNFGVRRSASCGSNV